MFPRVHLKKFFLILGLMVLVGVPFVALAQINLISEGAELPSALNVSASTDLRGLIVRVVQFFLGFLGLLAVILLLYGGFLWMTSRGNEEQVRRAKRVLVNALIGLVIILSAWMIVAFVVRQLGIVINPPVEACVNIGDIESRSSPCSQSRVCQADNTWSAWGPNCPVPPQFFLVSRVAPPNNFFAPPGAPRNTKVRIEFNQEFDPTTLPPGAPTNIEIYDVGDNTGVASPAVAVGGTYTVLSGNRKIEFTPTATCQPPNQTLNCFDANRRLEIRITSGLSGVKSSASQTLTCSGSNPCTTQFDTNDTVDTAAPSISIEQPNLSQVADAASVAYSARGRDSAGVGDVCLAGKALVCSLNTSIACIQDADCAPGNGTCQPLGPPDIVLPGGPSECFTPLPAQYQNFLAASSWNASGQASRAFVLEAEAIDFAGNSTKARRCELVRPAHCLNDIQDATETGPDCGGDPVALGADYCGACAGQQCNAGLSPSVCSNANDLSCSTGNTCDAVTHICVPLPVITDFQERNGAPGNYITISGQGFGAIKGTGNVVFMGGLGTGDDQFGNLPSTTTGCSVNSFWSDRQIIVEVPTGTVTGPIRVTNNSGLWDDTTTSPLIAEFVNDGTIRPSLACSEPVEGCFTVDVVAKGKNFTNGASDGIVFGNIAATNRTFVDSSEVGGKVPNVQPGPVQLRVASGSLFSNPVTFTASACVPDPRIDLISPSSGPRQQTITITGAHFGNSTGEVHLIDGGTDLKINPNFPAQCPADALWTDTQIITRIPDAATPAVVQIKVRRANDKKESVPDSKSEFTVNTNPASPLLCALNPNRGPIGAQVNFIGEGFGAAQPGSVTEYTKSISPLAVVSPTPAATCAAILRREGKKSCGSVNCLGDGGDGDGYVSGDELDQMQRFVGTNCGGSCSAGYDPNNNGVQQSEVDQAVANLSVCAGSWNNTLVKSGVPAGAITGFAQVSVDPSGTSNALKFTVGACKEANDCEAGRECCSDGTCRLPLPGGESGCPAITAQAVSSYRWRFTAGDPAPKVDEQRQCSIGDVLVNGDFEAQDSGGNPVGWGNLTGSIVDDGSGNFAFQENTTPGNVETQDVTYGQPLGGLQVSLRFSIKANGPAVPLSGPIAYLIPATPFNVLPSTAFATFQYATPITPTASEQDVVLVTTIATGTADTKLRFLLADPPGPAWYDNFALEISPGTQSPSPWKDSTDACQNARLNVRFTENLSPAICTDLGAIQLFKCDDIECDGTLTTVPLSAQSCPQLDTLARTPVTPLTDDSWYLARVVASKVLSDKDEPMKALPVGGNVVPDTGYQWKFQVGGGACAIRSTQCTQNKSVITSLQGPNNTAYLQANLQAANCNILTCNATNQPTWGATSNPPGVLSLAPVVSCDTTATAIREGEASVSVLAAEGAAGMCHLSVRLADLRLIQPFPSCQAACLNAESGGVFNVSVNRNSVDVSSANPSVRLESCGVDEDCSAPANVALQLNAPVTDDGPEIRFVPHPTYDPDGPAGPLPAGRLAPNTYYRVTIISDKASAFGVASVDGKYLANPNATVSGRAAYRWIYKTSDQLCVIDRLITTPKQSIVQTIGAQTQFTVQPMGKSDACSPQGQRLNATAYDYTWRAEDVSPANSAPDDVATVTNEASVYPQPPPPPPPEFVDPVQTATAIGLDPQCSAAGQNGCSADIWAATPPIIAKQADRSNVGQLTLQCHFTQPGSCDSALTVAVDSVSGFCSNNLATRCKQNSDCGGANTCRKPDTNCDGKISGSDLNALQAHPSAALTPGECANLNVDGDAAGVEAQGDDLNLLVQVLSEALGGIPKNVCSNGSQSGQAKFGLTGTIAVSTTQSNRIVSTPDGKYLLVGQEGSPAGLDVIDVATRKLVRTIATPAGGVTGIAVSPDSQTAVVTHLAAGKVSFVSLGSGTVEGQPITVGTLPARVAFHPSGTKVYVSNNSANTVSVIDVASRSVVKTISGFSAPAGIESVIRGGTAYMYVANAGSNTVSVINSTTDAIEGTPITVGQSPRDIVVAPDTKRAYVMMVGSMHIAAINTDNQQLVGSPTAEGEEGDGIAISNDEKYLFVTNSSGGQLVVYTANPLEHIISVPIVGNSSLLPLGVASAVSGDIYVANGAGEEVSVLSPLGSCTANVQCVDSSATNQCGNGQPAVCETSGINVGRCQNDSNVPCLDEAGNPDSRLCNFAANQAGCCGARPWVESMDAALDQDGKVCRNSAFVVTFNTKMQPQSVRSSIVLERSDGDGNCSNLAQNTNLPWYQRLWNFIARLFGQGAAAQTSLPCTVEANIVVTDVKDFLGNPIKTKALVSPLALMNTRVCTAGANIGKQCTSVIDCGNGGTCQPDITYQLRVKGQPSGQGVTGALSLAGIPMDGDAVYPLSDPPAGYPPAVGNRICAIASINVEVEPLLDYVQQAANPRTLARPYDVFNCFGDDCDCNLATGRKACRQVSPTSTRSEDIIPGAGTGNQHRYTAEAITSTGGVITSTYRLTDVDETGSPANFDPQDLLSLAPDGFNRALVKLSANKNGLANVSVAAASGWTCVDGAGVSNGVACVDSNPTGPCGASRTCQGPAETKKETRVPVNVFLCSDPWRPTSGGDGFQDTEHNMRTNYCRRNADGTLLPSLNILNPAVGPTPDLMDQWLFVESSPRKVCDNQPNSICLDSNDCPVGGTCLASGQPADVAIGLRVYRNSRHLSPTEWYESQRTPKGSPQSTMVDGYPAVIDGRSTYIGASNATGDGTAGSPKLLYTNIYVLSYGEGDKDLGAPASPQTLSIYNQLIKNFIFNINILGGGACRANGTTTDLKVCSNDRSRSCADNSGCLPGGVCQVATCVYDSECPTKHYCTSTKQAVTRDTARVSSLLDIAGALENYRYGSSCKEVTPGAPGDADCNGTIDGQDVLAIRHIVGPPVIASSCSGADANLDGAKNSADISAIIALVTESCERDRGLTSNYPGLASGSYVQGATTSRWPSWKSSFDEQLEGELTVDPLNFFGSCPGYDAEGTCWSEPTKTYACMASSPPASCQAGTPPAVPSDSQVYTYTSYGTCSKDRTIFCQNDQTCATANAGACEFGAEYALCGFMESCYAPTPEVANEKSNGRRFCQVTRGSISLPTAPDFSSGACNFSSSSGLVPPPIDPTDYTLTINESDPLNFGDYVDPDQCVDDPCPEGTFVRVFATPNPGKVAQWQGCDRVVQLGSSKYCEVTMLSNRTVTVTFGDPPPAFSNFTTNPTTTIALGETATLSWDVKDATSLTLTGNNQPVPNCTSPTFPIGTCKVEPAGTTTYRLVASNAFGSDAATITVNVNWSPNFTAAPRAVDVTRPAPAGANSTYLLAVAAPNTCSTKTFIVTVTGGGTATAPICTASGIIVAEASGLSANSTFTITEGTNLSNVGEVDPQFTP